MTHKWKKWDLESEKLNWKRVQYIIAWKWSKITSIIIAINLNRKKLSIRKDESLCRKYEQILYSLKWREDKTDF